MVIVTPVAGVRAPLDVSAADQPVHDAGGRRGGDLEPSRDLGWSDLLATQVPEGEQLALAQSRPAGDDVVEPATGGQQAPEREQGACLVPLTARARSSSSAHGCPRLVLVPRHFAIVSRYR